MLSTAAVFLLPRLQVRIGDGKTHLISHLQQFPHGSFLSHLTLRVRQGIHAFGFSTATLSLGMGTVVAGLSGRILNHQCGMPNSVMSLQACHTMRPCL